jgi:transcription elongation GreA/GreB family factor
LFSYEGSYNGMQLKLRNQLGVLFLQTDWLTSIMAKLTDLQRSDILRRIKTQSGWEASDRRSLMGKMIKLYPELATVVATRKAKVEEPIRLGRYTSYRSFREKQDQLKKVVDVDIPENSKEIGIARSYGDLRENAEYETAKQNQGILMKRKTELEHDLVQVQASDFSQYASDSVGMGTCVTLEGESGDVKVYNVLGEWDGDEGLSIISSRSRLAEVLIGKVAGDAVELPGVDGGYKVATVVEVSDDIKTWMNAMPEAAPTA